ncbi:alpha/beta fold hydrolase [Streptomyces sp. NPDC002550]
MRMVEHRMVDVNGIRLHIAEQGDGPLVVLLHGFPESWHSWQHQFGPLADAGFRVVAPDQRGYGLSDHPDDVGAYTILHLVGDVVGLIQALGEEKAYIVGHDWGAPVAWHTALLRPDMVLAVAGLSVPPPLPGGRASAHRHGQEVRRPLLLELLQPSRRGRRRVRPGHAHRPAEVLLLGFGRRARRRPGAAAGRPGAWLARDHAGSRSTARVVHRGRPRRTDGKLRRGLHRGTELVPQPRPQLGTDRSLARRRRHQARPVRLRRPRPRPRLPRNPRTHPSTAGVDAQSVARAGRTGGLRTLDPAGASGRGERGTRGVPSGVSLIPCCPAGAVSGT